MFSFIEELQQKPENERRRIHLAVTVAITAVVIAVWATTLLDTGKREVIIDHRNTSPVGRVADMVSGAFIAVGEQVIKFGDRVVEIRDELF